eukprot:1994935-Rhodomonas_salina.2
MSSTARLSVMTRVSFRLDVSDSKRLNSICREPAGLVLPSGIALNRSTKICAAYLDCSCIDSVQALQTQALVNDVADFRKVGDEAVINFLFTKRCERSVLGARKNNGNLLRGRVNNAGARGAHIEQPDEELARVGEVALRTEPTADLVQLAVGDGNPCLLLSIGATLDGFHGDGGAEAFAAAVHELCLHAHHRNVGIDNDV